MVLLEIAEEVKCCTCELIKGIKLPVCVQAVLGGYLEGMQLGFDGGREEGECFACPL